MLQISLIPAVGAILGMRPRSAVRRSSLVWSTTYAPFARRGYRRTRANESGVMRIVLSADMEGVSQITDPREVNAAFTEYWETGRDRYNSEVAAAARGLLAGGATEVVVLDNHASGN